MQKDDELNSIRYQLPDGKILQLGSARFRAPEVLFDPTLVGLEYRGVHHTVLEAIAKADLDLRRSLYSTVLLSGGSTTCFGFGQRLLNELQAAVNNKATKIKIYAPVERQFCLSFFPPFASSLSFVCFLLQLDNVGRRINAFNVTRICADVD